MRVGVEMVSAGEGLAPAAGGMVSYYSGLLPELARRPEVGSLATFVDPRRGGLGVPAHEAIAVVPCSGLPQRRWGRVAYEQVVLPRVARRADVDVLLCTHNVLPSGWRRPAVVVLQSVQYFFLGDRIGAARRGYLRAAVPRSLRRAEAVIAVSETERRRAIELFGLDPDRIVTVHHGPPPWLARVDRTRTPSRGRPYVLAVSRLYGFKNHRRLIEAFAQVVDREGIDHELVVVGGDADVTRAELAAHARAMGVGDRVRLTGAVDQAELTRLYAGADAAAYVSLYETFGLPVLEALAFGLPLVTSSGSATAEVADGAARLAAPDSVDAIAEGLAAVTLDSQLRARLEAAGRRRLEDFSWDRCAADTAAVLARAGGGANGARPAAAPATSLRAATRPHIPDEARGVALPPRYAEPWFDGFLGRVETSLRPGVRILDVGSGRLPVLPPDARPAGARYVGLDVSAGELDAAPPGSYDETIAGDIAAWLPEPETFDLVVCWQVLEHVHPLDQALDNLRRCLAPNGRLLAHLSGAWSLYGLLNRVVPDRLSDRALHRLLGRDTESVFPAQYDRCHHRGLTAMLAPWSEAEVVPLYRGATYFRFSAPLQRAYLPYENACYRHHLVDLATHYLVDARR